MRFKKSWVLGAFAGLAMLGAAACGGGDDDDTNGIADGSDPDIPAGSPYVDQDNLKFNPTKLTVAPGQDIYFKNSETALHTVDIEGENLSGNMRNGDVFVWTAPDALGDYQVTCAYHPQMKATITIAEATGETPAN